jgi:uncharacterized protein YndB with AHSA1/START domain
MVKKVLLSVFLLVLVAVVALAVVVALRPDEFRVERSAKINAPPEIVFAQVNDLRKWETWSPWAKLDPDTKYTYEGSTGKGSSVSWAGNDKVGKGRMTILDSESPKYIRIKLEFVEPMEATSNMEFYFKAEGEQTAVNWSMQGENNFMGKAFFLLMNAEAKIGNDFDKGLASLKTVAEAEAKK